MANIRLTLPILAFSLALTGLSPRANAADPPRRAYLPSTAAAKAVQTAVQVCKIKGYNVSATVLNTEGSIIAVLRGDLATPHTVENSFNKAYTAITLGPNQKVDSTAKILDAMKGNKGIGQWPLPPAPIKGITYFPGGIAIVVNGEYIASIGVAGAPLGSVDEDCALQGRAAALAALAAMP